MADQVWIVVLVGLDLELESTGLHRGLQLLPGQTEVCLDQERRDSLGHHSRDPLQDHLTHLEGEALHS